MANKIRIDSLSFGDYQKCASNGEGFRVVVWFAGCRHNCPGCHNKEEQDFNAGTEFTKEDINLIIEELNSSKYRGLSILGGEPFEPENKEAVLELCKEVKERTNKDIWIWSGSYKEELEKDELSKEILKNIDILVDGPFEINKKNLNLKFRGSSNQRIFRKVNGKLEQDLNN